jgi:hypothetical protein
MINYGRDHYQSIDRGPPYLHLQSGVPISGQHLALNLHRSWWCFLWHLEHSGVHFSFIIASRSTLLMRLLNLVIDIPYASLLIWWKCILFGLPHCEHTLASLNSFNHVGLLITITSFRYIIIAHLEAPYKGATKWGLTGPTLYHNILEAHISLLTPPSMEAGWLTLGSTDPHICNSELHRSEHISHYPNTVSTQIHKRGEHSVRAAHILHSILTGVHT